MYLTTLGVSNHASIAASVIRWNDVTGNRLGSDVLSIEVKEIKGNVLPVTISHEQPTNAHIYY